jgi:FAD/FMN-containing dehydrogenase
MSFDDAIEPQAWDMFRERLGDRLVRVEPLLQAGDADPDGDADAGPGILAELQNPFACQDHPGTFQTTGWLDGFVSEASPWAVAALTADDVAVAVRFANDHGVRIAVKGTGHDYLGRSSAPDSLLVWTHHMREVVVHDAFEISGGGGTRAPVPAITVGAGTRWLEAYVEATARSRYVQGGGCTSVGAAGGFTQGGGFGSFSRRFGTAAGNVLEIEVVTADGEVRIANEVQHPDLFWALRGGGGGTFGVVTKMTLRTHPMPETFGAAIGTIAASSDAGYRRLIREFVGFFADRLDNEHWGEQIRFAEDNTMQVALTTVGLDEAEARSSWEPFSAWLARHADDYSGDIFFAAERFARMWDVDWWTANLPDVVVVDSRPGQARRFYWWATNQGEVSHFLDAYRSRWLPRALFEGSDADRLADMLFEASRHWHFTLHMNKALWGAAPEAQARDRQTSINPAVFDASALLIMASNRQHAFPGVPGREPDLESGRANVARIDAAMQRIGEVAPASGSYVNETDYFEPDWQRSFWGDNYPRLLDIKRHYDPSNVFRVHHGVGSET